MTYLSIAVKAGVSESEGRQPCKYFCWKVAHKSTQHTAQHAVVQWHTYLLALEKSSRVGPAKKVAHITTAAAVSENNPNILNRSQCLVNTRSEGLDGEHFSTDRMRSINCDEGVNKSCHATITYIKLSKSNLSNWIDKIEAIQLNF